MDILCQRFTTSKLVNFEDLSSIATYGFRGEALASISHISHLMVTTKTKSSPCAWKLSYLDGVPSSSPIAVAGRNGTQIVVEDLFYNVPSRLRAFKSASDEYGKILDVIGRYSCHCENIAFTCKKYGDSFPSLNVPATAQKRDRIRTVFGSAIANELIDLSISGLEKYGFLGATGLVTNPNYSSKKAVSPVLFINERLVSCDPLKKALAGVYSIHLPRGGRYFAYLSLSIDPRNLDVNVHPTKREIRFLFEDEIIEHIGQQVQQTLADCGTSRTFQTQTVLPGSRASTFASNDSGSSISQLQSQKRAYEYNMVRTDSKQVKLTSIFNEEKSLGSDEVGLDTLRRRTSSVALQGIPSSSQYRTVEERRDRADVRLKSIQNLKDGILAAAYEPLTRVFADHTYIGIVDHGRRLAVLQHGVRMFIVDYSVLLQEYFYQVGVSDFSNFGLLTLDQCAGLSVRVLLDAVDPETSHDEFLTTLWDMRDMVGEYFSLTLVQDEDGELRVTSVPMLVKGYTPGFEKLPFFFHELATRVEWDDEQACLKGILMAIAKLYTPEPIPMQDEEDEEDEEEDYKENEDLEKEEEELDENGDRKKQIEECMDKILFPGIKQRFVAPKWMTDHIVEIANLPGLYKVFERC